MPSYQEQIERKYRHIARMPDGLMHFTVAVRKKAVACLGLQNGSSVLDVGCGTGASFPQLEAAVGPGGRILGVEPSRSMIGVAEKRVAQAGWQNISLVQAVAEEIDGDAEFDGALLFAMHDVFNSVAGLQRIHAVLKPGARIVCVGPKLQASGPLRLLNPMLRLLFKRMAISQENKDRPWRLVETVFATEQIIEDMHGLIFIYVGHKPPGASSPA